MNLIAQDVILRPITTEKSMQDQSLGKYTFQVHPKANKVQVRNAIEILFKVHVIKINTLKVRGKMRRFGRTAGKTRDWKKVVATLKPGDKIIIKGIEMFQE